MILRKDSLSAYITTYTLLYIDMTIKVKFYFTISDKIGLINFLPKKKKIL